MKNSVVDFNSIIEKAEERISKFENKSIVAIQVEENKEKREKETCWKHQGYQKCIMGVPKGEGT